MEQEKDGMAADCLHPEAGEGDAGIYVHIPFCRTKCPYCSFVSFQDMSAAARSSYMKALRIQAQAMAGHPWSRSRKFRSLFIGGGTPTTVAAVELADCIAACLGTFDFREVAGRVPEVTLEANPNSLTAAKLKRFREAGVNRLSIGIQSFSDTLLQNLGRTHTAADGLKAFALARAAGFTNINLDLMYGLPGQNAKAWEESLLQAVSLGPEHFSVYELTIEPGTPFAAAAGRKTLDLPPEEEVLAMFDQARQMLTANGYSHYEISNYARPGFTCTHNLNYWKNGSYLGLGSGAVSCFSGLRIRSEEEPLRFVTMVRNGRPPFREAEFLPLASRFRETVIMGLRLTAGVEVARLEQRFGLSPRQYYGKTVTELADMELLEEAAGRLRLTRKGLVLANRVMAELV